MRRLLRRISRAVSTEQPCPRCDGARVVAVATEAVGQPYSVRCATCEGQGVIPCRTVGAW